MVTTRQRSDDVGKHNIATWQKDLHHYEGSVTPSSASVPSRHQIRLMRTAGTVD